MADLSNYLVDEIGEFFLRNNANTFTPAATIYASLHSAAPNETGDAEITGSGSYARQAVTFDAFVDGVSANSGTLTFSALGAGNIHSVGLWDSLTGGQFYGGKALTGGTQAIPNGANFVIAAGSLDITIA